MKIRIPKILMASLFLLFTPMMCMHLGDDHHGGGHLSSVYQPSVHSLNHDYQSSVSTGQGGITIRQDSGGEN